MQPPDPDVFRGAPVDAARLASFCRETACILVVDLDADVDVAWT